MNSNSIELNLIDQLTLLALDDEKGTFVAESNAYSYALAGALIMELALQGRIELAEKKVIINHAVHRRHGASSVRAMIAMKKHRLAVYIFHRLQKLNNLIVCFGRILYDYLLFSKFNTTL